MRRALSTSLVAVMLSWSATSNAGFMYSEVYTEVNLQSSPDFTVIASETVRDEFAGHVSSSLNDTYSITGQDSSGNDQTMTIDYMVAGEASSGVLKSKAIGSITNTMTTLSDVPSAVSMFSIANFADDFSVSGSEDLSFISFQLGFDGLIDVSNMNEASGSMVTVSQNNPGASGTLFQSDFYGEGGTFDLQLTSILVPVVDGVANLLLELSTDLLFSLDAEYEGLDFEGVVDFSSTLRIVSATGFDNGGNTVELFSVFGSQGNNIGISDASQGSGGSVTVAEPSVLSLLALNLLAFGLFRRKVR